MNNGMQKKCSIGNMKSLRELALENKEMVLKEKITDANALYYGKAALKNPCVFGKWNDKFNKNCL